MNKPILSIQDLEDATEKEIREAQDEMIIMPQLSDYLDWLNSANGDPIKGEFSLGYHKRSLGVHPSTVSKKGTCPLRIYFEITGEVQPKRTDSVKDRLTFDLGTLIHVLLQSFFQDMYEGHFVPEVPLKNEELLISSHTDGRFAFPDLRFLLEIKSIKESMTGLYGINEVRRKPIKDHVRQAHCYMWADNTPFCNILYFCKNTSEIVEHPIVFNHETWQEIEDEIRPVVEAARISDPPIPRVGSHCKYCPFLDGCKWGKNHVSGARARRNTLRRRGS